MGGILFLCTGNASRSVMAESMLGVLAPGWDVASAGTHSVDGQPIGWRTRRALVNLGFDALEHRSHQCDTDDLAAADVVAVFEAFQLAWVRRTLPAAAGRATSLRRLAGALPPPSGPPPDRPGGELPPRVASMHLADATFEPHEEVVDPGGGELDDYVTCAAEVHTLIRALADRLGPAPGFAPTLS